MKKITLISFLLFYCSFISFTQEKEKAEKIVKTIYSVEQANEEEFWNGEIYPRPVMSKEKLIEFIQARISYPELAKKYYRYSWFLVPVKIDINGKASVVTDNITSNEFEQVAVSVLSDTNLKWIPGSRNKKNKEMLINIPFRFSITYNADKVYYNIVMFSGFHTFVMDSSENYTAFMMNDEVGKNFINDVYLMIPPSWALNREYGTVTLGFEVDTNGHIADLKVVNSVNKILDDEARAYIIKTNGKWMPAHKGGKKVPAYKYFNCYFNDAYFENLNNENTIWWLRGYYSMQLGKGYRPNSSLAHHDYFDAMQLLFEKKYPESLHFFDRAAKYFIKDVNLFYHRSISLHSMGNKEKACDDLQRVLDLAETEGFPVGITKQQVEELIVKFCQ